MNITQTKDGEKLLVKVDGRIDTVTAPEFEAFLEDNLDGISDLTIDLAALEYISSAGFRVMLRAQKRMNVQGTMTVLNVNETVSEIFEVTGFNDILTIK